jgi:trans-aconitate 3-methyltransferase
MEPTKPAPTTAISVPPASYEAPSDPTFRRYTATQAASYIAGRPAYPDALTQTILTHHTSTGGQLGTLLDVGCGPGLATRAFAPHFKRALGVDASIEMINAARASTGPPPGPASPESPAPPIHFANSAAESLPGPDLASQLPPGSVDLLTAATAAHWFDMSKFWPGAASLVRPGGTVALWTSASYYCHPHTTPNAARVQAVLDRLEHERLAPHKTRGNEIGKSLYRELGMPWDVGLVPGGGGEDLGFPREEFVRREWNANGKVEVGEKFFRGEAVVSLEQFAEECGTASMVTRWREAHPDLVGTDEDVISVTVRELREALAGREWFERGTDTGLLMFKRR